MKYNLHFQISNITLTFCPYFSLCTNTPPPNSQPPRTYALVVGKALKCYACVCVRLH